MANGKSQIGWRTVAIAVFVFVCAVLPFARAVTHPYSGFDDTPMLDQPGYHGLGWEQISWMLTTTHMGHYQPLAWLTFAMEWTLFGEVKDGATHLRAEVSHAVSIVLHGVNAVLVFLLARRLIGLARKELVEGAGGWARDLGAVLAAVLFAVHPLRVESVAWVTERRDVLSLLFYLLAVIWYLKANGEEDTPRRGVPPGSVPPGSVPPKNELSPMVWVWVFLILSLLSKAWGMTFFLVLLAMDWYPLRRLPAEVGEWGKAKKVLLEKVPFAVVGVAWAVVAGRAASSMRGTSLSLEVWGVMDRVCQACYGLVFYWWKTIWPSGLSALYGLPTKMSVGEMRVVVAIGVLVVVGVACVVMRKKWPAVVAAIFVYAVVVSPVLGFFQSGIQLVADRYSYIAMIAPMVVVGGWVAGWVAERGRKGLMVGVGAVVVAAAGLSVLTYRQTGFWKTDADLFGHALAVGHEGPVLRMQMGKALCVVNRVAESETHFRRAIELSPGYGEAWFSLGNTLKELKRFEEAKAAYAKAIELMPNSWKADEGMGLLLAERDDVEGALRYFRSAVMKIEGPENWCFEPGPYLLLAQALYDLGDVAGARRELVKAVKFRETRDRAAAALKMIGDGR